MADEQQPQRPPTSGPGSGLDAWRAYAAAVTGSPVESWAGASRDQIIKQFASEDVEDEHRPAPAAIAAADARVVSARPPANRSGRPKWMVPTEDGWVPEQQGR